MSGRAKGAKRSLGHPLEGRLALEHAACEADVLRTSSTLPSTYRQPLFRPAVVLALPGALKATCDRLHRWLRASVSQLARRPARASAVPWSESMPATRCDSQWWHQSTLLASISQVLREAKARGAAAKIPGAWQIEIDHCSPVPVRPPTHPCPSPPIQRPVLEEGDHAERRQATPAGLQSAIVGRHWTNMGAIDPGHLPGHPRWTSVAGGRVAPPARYVPS